MSTRYQEVPDREVQVDSEATLASEVQRLFFRLSEKTPRARIRFESDGARFEVDAAHFDLREGSAARLDCIHIAVPYPTLENAQRVAQVLIAVAGSSERVCVRAGGEKEVRVVFTMIPGRRVET